LSLSESADPGGDLSTINGLPAHVLLVHLIVVLAPLTAVLEILCGIWPAARRRLVWLVLALAAVTVVFTPLTTSAGEWLYNREGSPSAALQTHAERGDWMIYFSVALLIVAIVLGVLHWQETRSDTTRTLVRIVVAVVAIAVGASVIVAVIRIGDSGARAVWGSALAETNSG
jgi:hypothetical protein